MLDAMFHVELNILSDMIHGGDIVSHMVSGVICYVICYLGYAAGYVK